MTTDRIEELRNLLKSQTSQDLHAEIDELCNVTKKLLVLDEELIKLAEQNNQLSWALNPERMGR